MLKLLFIAGIKNNFLTASCVVSFETSNPPGPTVPIGNLRLSPRLIYENGGEVEDEDEIFNVLSAEPKTVTSTNEVFIVKFRIEKVSRRKDGKKFRLRFDYNEESSHLLDYVSGSKLSSVETTSITVLSKRKSPIPCSACSGDNGSKVGRRVKKSSRL